MNVLITGSTRGLGKALAIRFVYEGHDVIGHGRSAGTVVGDLRDADTIQRLCEAGRKHKIDILINNAGIYEGTTEDIIAVNLLAPILLTQGIYPMMKERGFGLIININSLAGKTFNPLEAVYCASKHGLHGFMGSFRHEARQHGVGILDVFMGSLQTGMKLASPGWENYISPDEAALTIYDLCQDYPTLRVNEVEIGRRVNC